jgi:hypothetical protein
MKKLIPNLPCYFRNLVLYRPSTKNFLAKVVKFTIIILLFGLSDIFSQTTVFSDNFESGSNNWNLQGTWGLVTSLSYSSSHSLSTATNGNYRNSQNISTTLSNGINLSSYKGAEIEFYGQYQLEEGFDYGFLEISIDGGNTWYQLDSFNGYLNTWTLFKYDIGGFAGSSNVLIRFRLKSDANVNYTGMYIDNFKIIGSVNDSTAPFISTVSPLFYQGVQTNDTVNAQIFDATGIQSATLYYKVDGVGPYSIGPSSVNGSNYMFIIPAQTSGAMVYYKIGATDSSPNHNASDTSNAAASYYISGTYLNYDAGTENYFNTFNAGNGAAVKISMPAGGKGTLVAALIRNYIDSSTPENDMLFHVWADNGGAPGSDLITPFTVTPAATLTNPYPMTVVDLRPYSSQLSSLTGDVYIGFTVPSGTVNVIQTNSASSNRSFNYNGSSWSSVTSTDYEMRAVVDDESALPVELTTFTASSVKSGIELKWSTATEVNNYGFEIERAPSSTTHSQDTWIKIGFVNGSGNSNSPKEYTYFDNNLTGGTKFQYRLKQIDNNGNFEYSNTIEVSTLPAKFELSQNYPNPFNPSTSIKYYIPKNSYVTLVVYDMLGREVISLVNEQESPGYHEVSWNGLDNKGESVSSGIYVYKLTAGSFTQTKKMNLLK